MEIYIHIFIISYIYIPILPAYLHIFVGKLKGKLLFKCVLFLWTFLKHTNKNSKKKMNVLIFAYIVLIPRTFELKRIKIALMIS